MDYKAMYKGSTALDNLVRQKTTEGWKMFAHEHPAENSKIDIIYAFAPSNQAEAITGVTFQQKYLYKNGRCLGTCATCRFWKYSDQ